MNNECLLNYSQEHWRLSKKRKPPFEYFVICHVSHHGAALECLAICRTCSSVLFPISLCLLQNILTYIFINLIIQQHIPYVIIPCMAVLHHHHEVSLCILWEKHRLDSACIEPEAFVSPAKSPCL